MSAEVPREFYELPPSAKLVFTVLREEGQLTQKQLATHTLLSPRTVRHALTELESIDAVERQVNFADARQHIYSVARVPGAVAEP